VECWKDFLVTEINGIAVELSNIADQTRQMNTFIHDALVAVNRMDGQMAELKFAEYRKSLKLLTDKVADAKRHLDELKSKRT
jgi:hypothetical protein